MIANLTFQQPHLEAEIKAEKCLFWHLSPIKSSTLDLHEFLNWI